MRVTSKGQVTIPIELRERWNIGPGAEVEFLEESDGILIRRAEGDSPGRRLAVRLRGSATSREMTTDEIMALTRGDD